MQVRTARVVGFVLLLTLAVLLASGSGARAADRAFDIELMNFRFQPAEISVAWNDNVTIHVYNNDSASHTFDIDEFNVHIGTRGSPVLAGGQGSAVFSANRNGTFWFYCNIEGHASRQADGTWVGMAGRLIVGVESKVVDPTLVVIGGTVVMAITVAAAVSQGRKKP